MCADTNILCGPSCVPTAQCLVKISLPVTGGSTSTVHSPTPTITATPTCIRFYGHKRNFSVVTPFIDICVVLSLNLETDSTVVLLCLLLSLDSFALIIISQV